MNDVPFPSSRHRAFTRELCKHARTNEQLAMASQEDGSEEDLFRDLSDQETRIEERIRTLCLCVIALGVVGCILYYLRIILVPLVLAVALSYLLQPLIELLHIRPRRVCGVACCGVPHWLASCVALVIAFAVFGLLGFVVADSIHSFSEHADVYAERVRALVHGLLGWMESVQQELRQRTFSNTFSSTSEWTLLGSAAAAPPPASNASSGGFASGGAYSLEQLVSNVPLTSLVFTVAGSLLESLSNLLLVLLFTVYLLLGKGAQAARQGVHLAADAQIFAYIKGKVLLSLGVGVLTALTFKVHTRVNHRRVVTVSCNSERCLPSRR